jgi:hypothetical protein
MLCGAYRTALVFSVLNVAVLAVRIRVEERALSLLGSPVHSRLPRFIPAWGRSDRSKSDKLN